MFDEAALQIIIDECFRRRGNPETFQQFYDAFHRPLALELIRMVPRQPHLVDDALQSAFLKFLTLFRAGPQAGRVYRPAYFLVAGKRMLIDMLRKNREVPLFEELITDVPMPPHDVELEGPEDILLIALSQLEPRCEFILTRHYIQQLPTSELVELLGVNKEAFYVILGRCRQRLKTVMEQLLGLSG